MFSQGNIIDEEEIQSRFVKQIYDIPIEKQYTSGGICQLCQQSKIQKCDCVFTLKTIIGDINGNYFEIITKKVFKGNQSGRNNNICVFYFRNLHNYDLFQQTLYKINKYYKQYHDYWQKYNNDDMSIPLSASLIYGPLFKISYQKGIKQYLFQMSQDDSKSNYICKILRDYNINMSGYNKMFLENVQYERNTNTIKCKSQINNIQQIEINTKYIPLNLLTWDIEVYFKSGQIESDFQAETNELICIGGGFSNVQGSQSIQFCITQCPCNINDSNIVIIQVNDEAEIIDEFMGLINLLNPSIITGFNDNLFDWKYIKERIELHGLSDSYKFMFRKKNIKIKAGFQKEGLNYVHDGIIQVDTRTIFTQIQNLEKQSLNEYLKHNNLDLKLEISFRETNYRFEKYKQKQFLNAEDNDLMFRFYQYCAYDADACRLLWQKAFVLGQYIELCSLSHTPLRYGFYNANGIKVLNLVSYYALQNGFSVPMSPQTSCYTKWIDINMIEQYSKFPGAFVPQPKTGVHITPIIALDFASLYPSIIIANNLSPETIIDSDTHFQSPHNSTLIKIPFGIATDLNESQSYINPYTNDDEQSYININHFDSIYIWNLKIFDLISAINDKLFSSTMFLQGKNMIDQFQCKVKIYDPAHSLSNIFKLSIDFEKNFIVNSSFYQFLRSYNTFRIQFCSSCLFIPIHIFDIFGDQSLLFCFCCFQNKYNQFSQLQHLSIYENVYNQCEYLKVQQCSIINAFLQNNSKDLDKKLKIKPILLPCLYNGYVINSKVQTGLYPIILQKLFSDRKSIKNQIKLLQKKQEQLQNEYQQCENQETQKQINDVNYEINRQDAKQLALKIFMNTFYGEAGNSISPLFDISIAGGTTSLGRFYIKQVHNILKQKNCDIIYGDTDSVYIKPLLSLYNFNNDNHSSFLQQTFDIAVQLQNNINDIIGKQTNNKVKMEFEEILLPSLFIGKKKYCGVIYNHTDQPIMQNISNIKQILIKGIDFIKQQYPALIKQCGYQMIINIMNFFNSFVFNSDISSFKSLFDMDCNSLLKNILIDILKNYEYRLKNISFDDYHLLSFNKKIKENNKSGEMYLFYQRFVQDKMLRSFFQDLLDSFSLLKHREILKLDSDILQYIIKKDELDLLQIPIPLFNEFIPIIYTQTDSNKISNSMQLIDYAVKKQLPIDVFQYFGYFKTMCSKILQCCFIDKNFDQTDDQLESISNTFIDQHIQIPRISRKTTFDEPYYIQQICNSSFFNISRQYIELVKKKKFYLKDEFVTHQFYNSLIQQIKLIKSNKSIELLLFIVFHCKIIENNMILYDRSIYLQYVNKLELFIHNFDDQTKKAYQNLFIYAISAIIIHNRLNNITDKQYAKAFKHIIQFEHIE